MANSIFFNTPKTPRVSGTPEPTFWENLEKNSPEWILGSFDFFVTYSGFIFIIILGLIFLQILRNSFFIDRKKIEKLWKFILFFLSKRHMMIPMIITFSKKNNSLNQVQRLYLLETRNETKKFPLKYHPQDRFKKELEVSKILFEYFQILEQSGALKRSKKLKKVVNDLEFIDQKLIQLQLIYNREAKKWNKCMKRKFFLRNRVSPFFDFELFNLDQK